MLKKISTFIAIFAPISVLASTDPILVVSNMVASVQMTNISGNLIFDKDSNLLGSGFSNSNSSYTSPGRVILTALDGTRPYLIQYDSSTSLYSTGSCCNISMNNIYFDVLGVQNNHTVPMYDGQVLSPILSGTVAVPECAIGCSYTGTTNFTFGDDSIGIPISLNILQASNIFLIQPLDFGVLQKGTNFSSNGGNITMSYTGTTTGSNLTPATYNSKPGIFSITPQKTGSATITATASNPYSSDGVSFTPKIYTSGGTEILSTNGGTTSYNFTNLNTANFYYTGTINMTSSVPVGNYDMSLIVRVDY